MPHIQDILTALEQQIPLGLAEPWDNVGLLLGDAQGEAQGIMTCLTLTEDVADEAIAQGANLIVTHHPILFKAVKRLTSETAEGRMLLSLVRAGVSVYSPHTAFDSAREGINQQICQALGLGEIRPLRPKPQFTDGSGRMGVLASPIKLVELLRRLQSICPAERHAFVGDAGLTCQKIAVACGAAGEFLTDAAALGCEVLITGETRLHTCLEARSQGIALILVGHYASERPAVENLADALQSQWPSLRVWASRTETDPLQFT
jgi:dinuclear metal center YbgI/SA1388 family protein